MLTLSTLLTRHQFKIQKKTLNQMHMLQPVAILKANTGANHNPTILYSNQFTIVTCDQY